MFNESQQRYLITRLKAVETNLTDALEKLQPSDPARVFRTLTADATATQRKVLHDYLAQVRFALRRFTLAQQLGDDQRIISGLWSFRTTVIYTKIVAVELRSKYWSGCGEVDPAAAAATERLSAELTTLLRRIEDYLERGEGGGLAARVAALAATTAGLDLLRQLERIISTYGLTELRAPLALLVDRAANPRFEIAILGRVSSGKSSLLNWWLGEPVLPVGVTPVTAIPTRIVHGEPAGARVKATSSPAIEIPLVQLSEYVTEHDNPQNSKGLLEVIVQMPARRLTGGVCLVDTPGVGSLATSGAIQTLEYLPNCDLGILLIEAGAAVTQEDLDIARALVDGGSDLVVLLSKADRLSAQDLQQMLTYVSEQFGARLGVPVQAHAISVVPPASALMEAWFDQELVPLLERHRERAAEILHRKITVLRESVMAVLRARLAAIRPDDTRASQAMAPQRHSSTHEDIAQAHADFESSRSQLLALRQRLAEFGGAMVEAAADGLTQCWLEGVEAPELVRERVRAAIGRCAEEAGQVVARMLSELREELQRILEGGAREDTQELAPVRGRPTFDVTALVHLPDHRIPHLLPRVRRICRTVARARVEAAMLPLMRRQLTRYGEALSHWGLGYLKELETRFDAAAALFESMERFGGGESLAQELRAAAQRDLELLESWPTHAARTQAPAAIAQ